MSQHGANIQCTAGVVIFQMKCKTTFLHVHRGLRIHYTFLKATALLLAKLSHGEINSA